tara:strand:- start:3694 stop:4188 length:495 start_codon:yes stop_codon:yes gene_type:complete
MFLRNIKINNTEKYKQELLSLPKIELTGIVKYDPERKGLKDNSTCCVIEVEQELIDFYRNMVNVRYGINLIKPPWKAHISVIQQNLDRNSELLQNFWKKYEGLEVDYSYYPFPRFTGDTSNREHYTGRYWFLSAECDLFYKIREELGLKTNFAPHITIGKYQKN